MANPKSVEETRDMKSLDRSQLYAALTGGHEIPFNIFGTVHPFSDRITEGTMDAVHEAITKFEGDGRPKYGASLGEIHEAYQARDLDEFRRAIGNLFLDFVMD
jgi:hypothetical protein